MARGKTEEILENLEESYSIRPQTIDGMEEGTELPPVESADFSSEELEEIKETVIQQLVVSYNLYKSIRELYDNKESEIKVVEKLQNVLSDITNISSEVNKVVQKEIEKTKTYSYISIGIGVLNFLILIALFLFK